MISVSESGVRALVERPRSALYIAVLERISRYCRYKDLYIVGTVQNTEKQVSRIDQI